MCASALIRELTAAAIHEFLHYTAHGTRAGFIGTDKRYIVLFAQVFGFVSHVVTCEFCKEYDALGTLYRLLEVVIQLIEDLRFAAYVFISFDIVLFHAV